MVLKTIAAPCRSCLPSPELQNLECWSASACPPFVDHWFAHDAQNGFTRNHISFHSRRLRRLMWFSKTMRNMSKCAQTYHLTRKSSIWLCNSLQRKTQWCPVACCRCFSCLGSSRFTWCQSSVHGESIAKHAWVEMGWTCRGSNVCRIFYHKLGQILKSGCKEKQRLVHTLAPKAS